MSDQTETRAAIVNAYRQLVTEARSQGYVIAPVVPRTMTDEQIVKATDELKRLMNAKVGGILPIGKPDLVD